MAGTGYIWFWLGDGGSWTPFSEEHQDIIERARIQGEPHAVIHNIGQNSAYMIIFADGIQENMANGNRRPISQARESTVWFWKDNDGHSWNLYGQEEAVLLSRAETGRENEVYLMIGQTLYRVDLARREQINFENGHSRAIHQGRPPTTSSSSRAATGTVEQEEPDEPDPEGMKKAAPPPFLCPISLGIMRDPVNTSAGSTYDRSAIEQWLENHDTDPLTNRNVEKYLVPNRALSDAIADWKTNFRITDYANADTSSNNDIPEDDYLKPSPSPNEGHITRSDPPISKINDSLKVIFLGNDKMGTTTIVQKLVHGRNARVQSINQDNSPPTIDIQKWRPKVTRNQDRDNAVDTPICFNIWDFVGRDVFHAHRAVFFSPQTLYVLVWDMGVSNPETHHSNQDDATKASQALRRDITDKVQFWVNLIEARISGAKILVVASFCDFFNSSQKSEHGMALGENEAKRRCRVLRQQLEAAHSTILFGTDEDPVIRVSGSTLVCLDVLRQRLVSIGTDRKMFGQLGMPIPKAYLRVCEVLRSIKNSGCKIVDFADISSQVGDSTNTGLALSWLSTVGECLSFRGEPAVPKGKSEMVILDIPWFSRISGCMLLRNWKAIVSDGRRRSRRGEMERFAGAVNDNYPLISLEDSRMLWQNYFVVSYRSDLSTLGTLLEFLQLLLVHFGVIVPVDRDVGPLSRSKVCSAGNTIASQYLPPVAARRLNTSVLSVDLLYIPSLLETGGLNTLHRVNGPGVVVAQVVDFLDDIPAGLMERIIGVLLHNTHALVSGRREAQDVYISSVKTLHCWRSIFQIKFVATDSYGNESVAEVCSQLVDSPSGGSKAKENTNVTSRLFTIAKEIQGDDGRDIWQAGYGLVLETIHSVIEGYSNLKHYWRTFCPQCLTTKGILRAKSWPNEELLEALEKDNDIERHQGHEANMRLLTGNGDFEYTPSDSALETKLKHSVVLIGLYDDRQTKNKIRMLGSGFVVDSARGLVVTSARTLMRISGEERFGQNYFGIVGGKIVVGVIIGDTSDKAVFRYFARVYAKDPAITDPSAQFCTVDACVLKIMSRFENDVSGNGDGCHDEIELLLRDNVDLMRAQELVQLPIAANSDLEERVRIIGYEQQDESVVNHVLSSTEGYICQQRVKPDEVRRRHQYQPSKTTVVMSRAKPGHIGGPCFNQKGEVVGLLSCTDPSKDSRSFVVPVSEWQDWLPPHSNT